MEQILYYLLDKSCYYGIDDEDDDRIINTIDYDRLNTLLHNSKQCKIILLGSEDDEYCDINIYNGKKATINITDSLGREVSKQVLNRITKYLSGGKINNDNTTEKSI